jgi:hypothetical protein
MRGAPAKAIQELAGHSHLTTTYRYMHPSPAAPEGAIRLMDRREDSAGFGNRGDDARRGVKPKRLRLLRSARGGS